MKAARIELVLPQWLKDAVKAEAEKKDINMSEYIKDILKFAVMTNSGKGENKP